MNGLETAITLTVLIVAFVVVLGSLTGDWGTPFLSIGVTACVAGFIYGVIFVVSQLVGGGA